MNVLEWLRLKANVASLVLALAGVLTLGVGSGLADEWQVRMPVQKTARIAPLADPADAQNASAAVQPGTPAPKAAANTAPKAAAKAAPKTALGRAAEAAAAANNAPKPSAEKSAADKSLAEKTAADAPVPAAAVPTAATPAAKPEAKAPADKHASGKSSANKVSADKAPADKAAAGNAAAGKPVAEPDAPGKAAKPVAATAKEPKPSAPATPKAKPAPVAVIDPKASVLPPAASASPAPLALPKDGKWVGDVRVEFQAESIILHAATNTAVERVTWFNLADPGEPRKLAVDLRGPWRKKGAPVLRFDVGPVKSVVVGEHEDRLRLSVEFRDGAVAKELSPVLERGPQGVTLTIPLAVRLAS